MVTKLLAASGLMAVCVAIHAGGLAWAIKRLRRSARPSYPFWAGTRLFVFVAVWMLLLHLSEISVWAVFYLWKGAMSDLPTAMYFSAVTYTTTGYGDLVLPQEWRLAGAAEALTGILMCGWSTGFFFSVVNRLDPAHASLAQR
jgi:tryptophan-rich sensory protein